MVAYLNPVDRGRQIVLNKAIILLGRHPDCDVVLTRSRKISRRHCCIVQVNDKLIVRDLGSMNGVRVNGKKVRNEAPLHLGDEVTVGDIAYVVEEAQPVSRSLDQNRSADQDPSAVSSNPNSASPKAAVNISQDFPIPLPEEEIPDIELDDLLLESGVDLENNASIDDLLNEVMLIEDSGEFEDQGSEIEIVSE
jgi:pSer/pThr/pTyr-binding forkhead associated (FHA) protein